MKKPKIRIKNQYRNALAVKNLEDAKDMSAITKTKSQKNKSVWQVLNKLFNTEVAK